MEIMLEIGESCVKPLALIDLHIWKVSLDYRIGQYGQFFKFFNGSLGKLSKKVNIAYKMVF